MIDVKCKSCDKLLFKTKVFIGAVKCSRCKMIFEYNITLDIVYNNNEDPRETQEKINSLQHKNN